jgi:hypothetical protein
MQSYPDAQVIEDNTKLLKQKYLEAQQLSKGVNEVRDKISTSNIV